MSLRLGLGAMRLFQAQKSNVCVVCVECRRLPEDGAVLSATLSGIKEEV